MQDVVQVLRFGWPYLRRYSGRFASGVMLAVLFGLTNAVLLWAINTILLRMSPGSPAPHGEVVGTFLTGIGPAERWRMEFQAWTATMVDTWLPRAGRPADWRQIAGGLLLFPLLAALRGFMGYGSSYCLAWVSERVVNDLRVEVLRKLGSLSLDYFNRATIGDLITMVNGDTAMLQRCLGGGLSDLVKEPVTVIGLVAMLFAIDWRLTLMVLVFFPLLVIPIVVLGKKVRRSAKAGLNTTITQASLIVEILSGIRVVKAFNLEDHQVERFRRMSKDLVAHSMRTIRAKEITNPIIETIGTLGFGFLLVVIVLRQVKIEDMVTLLTGVAFIYTPIKKLAGVHNLIQQTQAGIERLVQVLGERPTVEEAARPLSLPDFRSALSLDCVGFSYGHGNVLADVSIEIPRGTKLGIAGESGSGKSTLVNLLFRFYDPVSGCIRIDGKDFRDVSIRDLRERMALVGQEVVLFDMTVAENIGCGRSGATQKEIEEAARAAFAHDFILRLPQGYQTRVAERGLNLSGGQRQRLAIARAFIRDAPILVLDEATAALDAQSEAEVQVAIERLEENRTVICVAHRLSTLRNMDRIIVLSAGRVVEDGTFTGLVRGGDLFADMARRQGIAI